MFFCILLFFTLFFLHFLSLLYWQCMLLHVIFGILHHSFLIVCVPGSLPFPARRQMLSFTICRIFYPEKHKCRCMRQRHLNKERNFFGGESVLCIEEIFLSSSMDGKPRPTSGCPSVLRLPDVHKESETPSTSGEGERKFTESYTHPFPFSFPYHFFQITISKIH